MADKSRVRITDVGLVAFLYATVIALYARPLKPSRGKKRPPGMKLIKRMRGKMAVHSYGVPGKGGWQWLNFDLVPIHKDGEFKYEVVRAYVVTDEAYVPQRFKDLTYMTSAINWAVFLFPLGFSWEGGRFDLGETRVYPGHTFKDETQADLFVRFILAPPEGWQMYTTVGGEVKIYNRNGELQEDLPLADEGLDYRPNESVPEDYYAF